MTRSNMKNIGLMLEKVHLMEDELYELKGPTARVWWLLLHCPEGATLYNMQQAFCKPVRRYKQCGTYSRYETHDLDISLPRIGSKARYGAYLSGLLCGMLKRGLLVWNQDWKGPKGGRVYQVGMKIPREVLR